MAGILYLLIGVCFATQIEELDDMAESIYKYKLAKRFVSEVLEANLATLLAHTEHASTDKQVYLPDIDAYLDSVDLTIAPVTEENLNDKDDPLQSKPNNKVKLDL
jgi:hypothetical protein